MPDFVPCQRSRPEAARGGFSLVELLAVVAILMLLMAVAVTTMMPTAARARQAARAMLEGQLARTRSHAVSAGVPTALLFAGYQADGGIAGRATAVVEVEWDDQAAAWKSKRVLSRWEAMPGQVVFFPGAVANCGPTLMDRPQVLAARGPSGADVSGPFLLFGPNGGVEWPAAGEPLVVAFGSGAVQGGGVQATEKGPDGVPVHDRLLLSRLTGRSREMLDGR